MSSILTSQGIVLATAMAAFTGTLFLLSFSLQKSSLSSSNSHHQVNQIPLLRPCLSSGERKAGKKKKRVRFAEDVVDTTGDNEVFRRQHNSRKSRKNGESQSNEMPANRVALYNGILRNRMIHRMTYSY